MSKNFIDLEERQCKNKKQFLTRKDAKRSARRRYTSYKDMQPYKCPWCEMWHVGHRRGREKKYKEPGQERNGQLNTCKNNCKPLVKPTKKKYSRNHQPDYLGEDTFCD